MGDLSYVICRAEYLCVACFLRVVLSTGSRARLMSHEFCCEKLGTINASTNSSHM